MPATMRAEAIEHLALSSLWEVSINSGFVCHAVTPPVRGEGIKVYGETAIDSGMYDAFIRVSPSRNTEVIELSGVKNFKYIQFHYGNFIWDSDGCFFVGQNPTKMDVGITTEGWQKEYIPKDFKLSAHCVTNSKDSLQKLINSFKFKKVEKCHVIS